jgi:hypothetical protein
MTTRLDGELIRLEGLCRVEEAETLAGLLAAGGRTVDLSECEAMHGAVAQALLAFRPALAGAPRDAFLRELLVPALQSPDASATIPTAPSMKEPPASDPASGQ